MALNELFGKMKDSDSYQKIFLDKNNYEQYESIMVLIILLRPKSRGTLRLRSSDPQDLPNIDPRYLTNTEDMKTLEAGMKWALQLSETRAFKKHQFKELPMPYLCPDESKTYECLIRKFAVSVWHLVGTCRMGVDPMAVVDPRSVQCILHSHIFSDFFIP